MAIPTEEQIQRLQKSIRRHAFATERAIKAEKARSGYAMSPELAKLHHLEDGLTKAAAWLTDALEYRQEID